MLAAFDIEDEISDDEVCASPEHLLPVFKNVYPFLNLEKISCHLSLFPVLVFFLVFD